MHKIITSIQNPAVIAATKLHQRKYRYAQQRFLAEGARVCTTLIEANITLDTLMVTEKMLAQAQQFTDSSHIIIINESVMRKISTATTPSGIVGIFNMPKYSSTNSTLEPGLVLARISDPGNMGTLIRTCAAMGKKTVFIIEGTDPWSPKVVQASAGTIGLVNIAQGTWQQLLTQKGSLPLCALVVTGGKKAEKSLLEKSLLIVGSEAHGIPEQCLQDCEYTITLAMPGKTESLNAAVAGSIAMYLGWAPF